LLWFEHGCSILDVIALQVADRMIVRVRPELWRGLEIREVLMP
jgi:hypothetical protein